MAVKAPRKTIAAAVALLVLMPATAQAGNSTVDTTQVFVRDGYGALDQKSYSPDTNSWSDWFNLAGSISAGDAPAAVSWGPGRLDVFVRTAGGVLGHTALTSTAGWSAWESFPGGIASAPAVGAWAAGRLDVFARGPGNELLHKWYDVSGWHAWE